MCADLREVRANQVDARFVNHASKKAMSIIIIIFSLQGAHFTKSDIQ